MNSDLVFIVVLVLYSRFSVEKNKKSEEFIVIVNLKYLHIVMSKVEKFPITNWFVFDLANDHMPYVVVMNFS